MEYAELLKEQERAAEAGDQVAFEAVVQQIAALQGLLDELPAPPPPAADEDAEITGLRQESIQVLQSASLVQQRLAQGLRNRRNAARAELRELEGRPDQVRSYLDRLNEGGSRLNVRF